MDFYPTDGSRAVHQLPLSAGDRVRLAGANPGAWWTVQAVSPNYAACTRVASDAELAEDDTRRAVLYTVLDWRNGVRGPCDLMGQSYGDGTYNPRQCEELLAAFEVTDDDVRAALVDGLAPRLLRAQVSQRNWAPLTVLGWLTAGRPEPAPG